MKIDVLGQKLDHIDADNRAHVQYRIQIADGNNDAVENERVQIFDGIKELYEKTTDGMGEIFIELIQDIVDETRKELRFVIAGQVREMTFILDLNDSNIQNRTKRDGNRISACSRFFAVLGVGIVKENGKEYIMGVSGNLLSNNGFDKIQDFNSLGLSDALIGTKHYLINAKGIVLSEWYDQIQIYEESKAAIVKRGDKYSIISEDGKRMCDWFDSIEKASGNEGWFMLKKGTEYAIFAAQVGRIISKWFNGQILVKINGKQESRYSVINQNGFSKTGWCGKIEINSGTEVSALSDDGIKKVLFDNHGKEILEWLNSNYKYAILKRGGTTGIGR